MSIISTRLLISDKKRQFLDLKIGNAMMQKVTRMETSQVCTMHHSKCYAVLCCAVLCCSAVFCCAAVLCCAVLCCAVLCCAVLCCAVLCCAVLCCTELFWPVLCYALLCCVCCFSRFINTPKIKGTWPIYSRLD